MTAITTRYIGPTNYKGSRYKATAGNGQTITVSSNHALNSDENHVAAALALCHKMKWTGELTSGSAKNEEVFVFTGRGRSRPAYYTKPFDFKPFDFPTDGLAATLTIAANFLESDRFDGNACCIDPRKIAQELRDFVAQQL